MANILIVDDSRIIRRVLTNTLKEAGHEIAGEAANGEEALKILETVTPDLVTLDITMPVMDGLETLNRIKESYPDLKVIMISAAGQKNKVLQALKDGALDFIRKPFEKDEMLEVISKHL
ncbi:MAG: response regulator [Lachnospiraceae bacterium]|nr:response regulator [Lachnospiraceae bacterium]